MQKEVIQATLADDYGVDVAFRETTTILIERVAGTGAAAEILGDDSNPYLATVGLRVEAAPAGSGVDFRLEVELGSMPPAFFNAVEETVHATLGARRVTDCTVTMTHSGYSARQSHSHGTFDKSMSSTAGDFRELTPIVLGRALAQAGTTVHEPLHRFVLEAPADAIGLVLPLLGRLQAVPDVPEIRRPGAHADGRDPGGARARAAAELPALTRGEGLLETEFAGYRPSREA